jgi:hypothetical protein
MIVPSFFVPPWSLGLVVVSKIRLNFKIKKTNARHAAGALTK